MAYAVHVSGHLLEDHLNVDVDTLSVTTDSLSYTAGDLINVSGSVSGYDESDPLKIFELTLKLLDTKNNIITIDQISLNSDGSYSTFISTGGPQWKFAGDYTIAVNYGPDSSASTTFTFIIPEPEVIEEEVIEEEVIEEEVIEEEVMEEEQVKSCGPGTHLEDGVCMLDKTTEPTTGSSPTTGFNAVAYSIAFTVLIAFGIMIGLYLVSRASRTKTAELLDS